MSITDNIARIGNFTSSEIYKLLSKGSRKMTKTEIAEHKKLNPKSKKITIEDGFGELALTYIEEKNMERKHGLSLGSEDTGKAASWGKLLEGRVFNVLLDTQYSFSAEETDPHPKYDFWSGSKDGVNHLGEKAIVDFKCPKTRRSFSQLVDPIYEGFSGMEAINAIRFGWKDKQGVKHSKHSDGNKFYFQLVSNAIINGLDWAELIVYMPTKSELEAIKDLAQNFEGNPNKVAWVNWAEDNELPYLKDDGYYKNLNIIRFQIPQADKDLLTNAALEASKLLVYPKTIIETITPFVETIEKVEMQMDSFVKSLPPITSKEARNKAKKKLEEFKEIRNNKSEITE